MKIAILGLALLALVGCERAPVYPAYDYQKELRNTPEQCALDAISDKQEEISDTLDEINSKLDDQ